METLVSIVIMIVLATVFSKIANKNRKRRRSAGQTAQIPARQNAKAPGATNFTGFQKALEQLEFLSDQALSARQEPNLGTAFDGYGSYEGVSMGDSLTDDAGCVGGSMAHDWHEGQEFEGHDHGARPARVYTLEPETVQPGNRAGLSPRRMRDAVIMAEVLARPVGMRRRLGAR